MARRDESEASPGLTPDGKMLFALLAVILLGPYLPILGIIRLVGFEISEGHENARLDNVAVPLVAFYVMARAMVHQRLRIPVHIVWYLVFLAWLAVVTAIWWLNMPSQYAGSTARGVGLLRSIDAYVRPALILLITANVRVNRRDFLFLVRLILAVTVVIVGVAVAQLLSVTKDAVNPFLADYYDNSANPRFFWNVINQGRVASLMPLLSTLGMYMVLAVGLIGAQFFGAAIFRKWGLLVLLLGITLIGGMLSGSKVFAVGVGMLIVMSFLFINSMPKVAVSRLLATVFAITLVWIASAVVFPEQSDRLVGRVLPAEGNFVDQYFASRFDPDTGKVFRTGAVDIAQDYPITGLGMNVVNRTTDSMLLGIFIMSGGVGFAMYLLIIGTVSTGLYRMSRGGDRDLAAISRMLLLLTLVYFIIAIGFHTLIQDRAGDAYWILVGLLLGPLYLRRGNTPMPTGSDSASPVSRSFPTPESPELRSPGE
ncbi:MAG: hypothetical protein QF554_14170 [Dehalococcoidia bacterium]|nr:hypothetical protein [Dehalococcoidia bacterium]